MNDEDHLRSLHERLLKNDPTATAILAESLLDDLIGHLRRRFQHALDRDQYNDAAADAIIDYLKNPHRYDATKRGLRSYLRMAAEGDFKNLAAKKQRLKKNFLTGVELDEFSGNKPIDAENSIEGLCLKELRETLSQLFADDRDKEIAELIIQRERSTETYSRILQIEHLPLRQQQDEVKNHKDRIKKILSRFGDSIRDAESKASP